jgi:Ni/Fe-hydrogenase 1 B-type cytochrome subunit
MKMKSNNDRMKVYVWEFPVRFTHWVNFFCILTLSLTGYIMGSELDNPIYTKQYILSWIRFIHFVTAYVFLMSFIVRMYWSIAGNRYADMSKWIPITREKLRDLYNDIKHHLVLDIRASYKIGHTSLGSFIFLLLQLIFLFSLFSGFTMYSSHHTGETWRAFGEWAQQTVPLDMMKKYHKLVMCIFLIFVPGHLFMAWINHHKLRNRLMLSIFSGNKLIERDKINETLEDETDKVPTDNRQEDGTNEVPMYNRQEDENIQAG